MRMNHTHSAPLYQDRPEYGQLLRLILLVPVLLIAASVYYWSIGDASNGLAMLIGGLMAGLTYWFVFPRRYQVYEDHLRIVLGGPFSVKVGFQNVKAVGVTSKFSSGLNFATRIARTHVEIVKKRGMSIAITPSDAEAFAEEANRALSRWAETRAH